MEEVKVPLNLLQLLTSSNFQFWSNTVIQKMKSSEKKRSNSGSQEGEGGSEESLPLPDIADGISPYRFRKDVCYKFILRKFRNHYKEDFLFMTGYTKEGKSKQERQESFKQAIVQYCSMQGFNSISAEFPFYLSALIFPREAEEAVLQQKRTSAENDNWVYGKVLQMLELVKEVIKSYSEAKLRKVCKIYEVYFLLKNYIRMVEEGKSDMSGLIESDAESDKKYIWKVLNEFKNFVRASSGLRTRKNK